MIAKFPVFASDRVARCFQCGGLLKNHRKSGEPSGSGSRRGECAGDCWVSTWYDLEVKK